jgi:type IV pilus assembly protein PilN
MYNLDINFLNDRPEYKTGKGRPLGDTLWSDLGQIGTVSSGNQPLIIGAGVAIAALALAGGTYGFFLWNNQRLTVENEELAVQIADLDAKDNELKQAQAKVKQATDEIQALTSVFSNIKPWSAMSQDLRDRLPVGVQIGEIRQVAPDQAAQATPAPQPAQGGTQPAATPAKPPIGLIRIVGLADNFDKVNDFLVVLQKSNFLKPQETRIVAANLQQPGQLRSLDLPGSGQLGQKLPKLPPKVQFEIQTALTDVPTSELLRELDRKGAVGLVARIEALKEKGVIKP